MLAVVGIVGVLLVLLVPAFTSMSTSSTVTSQANSIKGVLENARTYAKANHTYVFVGIAEVDVSVDPLVRPQVTAGAAPYGRIAVATVASRDGTRHFDYRTASQGLDWRNGYDNGANLTAVGKLEVYENLHFIGLNFGSWTPTSHPISSMARFQISGYNIGTLDSVTPFSWPLGSALDDGYQYRFDKVINIDPRGVARVATATNADEVTDRIEIDFQLSRGNVTPTPPINQDVGNHFVIQIDAPTSAVRLYRP
jgi:type II secretory pathway pseudopilin PulG